MKLRAAVSKALRSKPRLEHWQALHVDGIGCTLPVSLEVKIEFPDKCNEVLL